jgi:hypothetical protein
MNSSKSCGVFINFVFLTFFPLGLFIAAASTAALSCDACDAASQLDLLTRLDRRGSGLMLELSSPSEMSSLEDISMLGVLESWVSADNCVSGTSDVMSRAGYGRAGY